MHRFKSIALSLLVLVASVADVWGQSAASSGQIVGLIVDQSGAVVPKVSVVARHTDTNLTRTTTTDAAGRYALPLLPLGPYQLTATTSGLEPGVREVTVSLGATVTANFKLGVGPVGEVVDVTAGGRTLEPSVPWAKSLLTDLQIQNLPASGRRIRGLFLLTPATQIEPECGGFAISGQKGLYINTNVDGGDYTNSHWCGHVEFSPTFSLEALSELQVLRSTFSAEFGRSTGGVINMSTKSGTNDLRGSGFYLFRNNAMTMRDPFDRQSIDIGQQFGGAVGGPIAKDRTFFLLAPEFQKNTKPVQVLYSVLDTQGVRQTAAAQELLRVAPEEQLQALSESQSVVARVDHRVSPRHGLMGRFDYIRNRITNNVGGVILTQGLGADSITNRALSNQALLANRNDVTGLVQLTSVLSPRWVNELRFQAMKERRPWNTSGSGPEVTVREAGATVAIYGPQASGLSYGNIGYRFEDERYQLVNNFTLASGAHTAKFGFDSSSILSRTTFNPGWNGLYTFNTLQDYANRRPFQYQQFAGSGSLDASMHQIAIYVQDEWRVRPGLTISPGLRYEMALLPDYYPATQPANRFPIATSIPDDKELIAPRLGVAWNIGAKGHTVVRAAGGLFYPAPYMPVFEQSMLTNGGNPELSSQVLISTTSNQNAIRDAFARFGIDLSSAPLESLPIFTPGQLNALVASEARIGQTVNFIDPNFRLPRAAHFRTAVEHQVKNGVLMGIDFTYINTTRIARVRNLNLSEPTPDATGRPVYSGPRPFAPKYGFVQVTEPSARSLYRATTASLNVKQSRFVFDAYYTLGWSYSHDDTERGISGIVFDDAFNLNNEYGYSNIDQRHQFTANGLVYGPAGFEISMTTRVNSGRPFSALAGSDLNRDGVLRDRPVVDGQVLPRNTYRNKGYSDLSLRVQRGVNLSGGKARALLSVEIFNVLNTANVEIGSANMVYGPGTIVSNGNLVPVAPPATFGRVRDASGNYLRNSTLRTAPFQVQIGARFLF